ncbi:unnamed protein product, partial [Adineta steineri]
KANGSNSSIKCRISDTHLFGLLKLMKTILYRQTFDQKPQKQNQIDIILLCALLDLTYYTEQFLHILFEIIKASANIKTYDIQSNGSIEGCTYISYSFTYPQDVIDLSRKPCYQHINLEENKRNDLITFDLFSFNYKSKTKEQYSFIKDQIQKSNFLFLYKYLQLILSS